VYHWVYPYRKDVISKDLEMKVFMQGFIQGFIKGAKETPRGFFAPVIAIWVLLRDTTDQLLDRP